MSTIHHPRTAAAMLSVVAVVAGFGAVPSSEARPTSHVQRRIPDC